MAAIRLHALTTAYLGGEQTIPQGARRIEFWGVDAQPATAHSAIWVRITSQAAVAAEFLIAAGASFVFEGDKGTPSSWTYNVKAAAGTPKASVVIL